LISPKEKSSLSKGQTYYLGDFVYIEPNDEKQEPIIICIESFEHTNNGDYLNGLQFFRPEETYHTPTQKFLRQEVFLTQTIEHIPMNKIQGLCYVLHVKDYFKYQPIIDEIQLSDEDVYVCESRYNIKTKMFKKIKWWNLPENKRVKLIQRDTPLENIRIPSTLVNNLIHRSSTQDNESSSSSSSFNVDIIEKSRETVLYDSVINEKLNENSSIKRDFYEQIVLSVTNNDKKFILRIDKIWKDNE
jgi:protein polybromo-1